MRIDAHFHIWLQADLAWLVGPIQSRIFGPYEQHIAHLIRKTPAAFGQQRCLWGSNFPIEKLWTDYASLITAYRRGVQELGPQLGLRVEAARRWIFCEAASRVYRA